MCRHLAWLGEPRTVSSLVLDPPNGLLVQSYAPRRQAHGRLNADGWGVGFYPAGRAEPARWRSARPLWSDESFASVAPALTSSCVLAAVRSATPGMPVEETAAAPFQDGAWLLSHNGVVERAVLPATERRAESNIDSAALAQYVFDKGPGALAETVLDVAHRDPRARLNLLLTNGRRILATTWGDTLSYLVDGDGWVVASEPYDDNPNWVDVPDRHLLELTLTGMSMTPLESQP
ncbi:ergothioneine biosynthesis protein EgtC [Intrasporangium mesophilum]